MGGAVSASPAVVRGLGVVGEAEVGEGVVVIRGVRAGLDSCGGCFDSAATGEAEVIPSLEASSFGETSGGRHPTMPDMISRMTGSGYRSMRTW